MLHPAGVASSIWWDAGYVDALRETRRLVMVDSLGYGLSSRPHEPETYAFEKQVVDIVAVLDALGMARADVFGYSMGGALAIALAIMSPESVRRLVVGGAAPPGMQPPIPKDYVRPVPLDRGPHVYAEAAIERRRSVGVVLSERSKRDLRNVDLEAVATRREAARASDLSGRLSEIRAPTMVVMGSEDPYADAAKRAAELIPDCAHKVIQGRSHIGAFADKDAMVREVGRFLHSR